MPFWSAFVLDEVTVTDGETTQIVLSQPTGGLPLGAANGVTVSAPGGWRESHARPGQVL
jgi:hypothetical protein